MFNRNSCITALAAALTLSLTSAAAAQASPPQAPPYQQPSDGGETDVRPRDHATMVCVTGAKSKVYSSPTHACAVAHETALREKRYDEALSLATIGCETYRNAADCRRAGRLPLVMGNESASVPTSFAQVIRRLAEFVCYSTPTLNQMNGHNGAGRECAYLARQFAMAKDAEYVVALEPAARRYFEATQDLALAAKLSKASCERLRYRDGCAQAESVGAMLRAERAEHVQHALAKPEGFERWTAIDRDDHDAGEFHPATSAELICRLGVRSARYPYPGAACIGSYYAALADRDFESALSHVVIGCTRHADHASCRRLANLPLLAGDNGAPIPASTADRLKQASDHVCLSPARINDVLGTDITARECAHLARRFVLARDPEYRYAMTTSARQFFEAIYDPAHATRLYVAACARFPASEACDAEQWAATVQRLDVNAARPIATSHRQP